MNEMLAFLRVLSLFFFSFPPVLFSLVILSNTTSSLSFASWFRPVFSTDYFYGVFL